MSKDEYEKLVKYQELEAIIKAQMHCYFAEGRGIKAMKVLRKIRLREEQLCQTAST
jgi:hypothetical protein